MNKTDLTTRAYYLYMKLFLTRNLKEIKLIDVLNELEITRYFFYKNFDDLKDFNVKCFSYFFFKCSSKEEDFLKPNYFKRFFLIYFSNLITLSQIENVYLHNLKNHEESLKKAYISFLENEADGNRLLQIDNDLVDSTSLIESSYISFIKLFKEIKTRKNFFEYLTNLNFTFLSNK